VCSGCGAVTELDAAVTDPFAAAVAERFGFEIDLRHFAITGRCRTCRAGRAEP
jgi:Fur family transcriptional regulator, ferric uptake regulator